MTFVVFNKVKMKAITYRLGSEYPFPRMSVPRNVPFPKCPFPSPRMSTCFGLYIFLTNNYGCIIYIEMNQQNDRYLTTFDS